MLFLIESDIYDRLNRLSNINYQKEKVIDINVKKVVEYIYDGYKLLREKSTIRAINPRDITPTYSSLPIVETINFIYDENSLIGFIYDGNTYYYVKDILVNIKYILDNSYNIVGKYEYDAWGNHQSYEYTSSGYVLNNVIGHILYVNPFRYKGYYYDVETQLFYCNSRYYSPELCRFISPDSIEYLDP